MCYPVDGVANGEQCDALLPQFASPLLHEGDNEGATVVIVFLIRVNHLHTVLGVRPERVCKSSDMSN